MTPQEHRAKAERIERSLAKCGPTDYEMKIEAAMLAGTHWLNLALHRMGVSGPELIGIVSGLRRDVYGRDRD